MSISRKVKMSISFFMYRFFLRQKHDHTCAPDDKRIGFKIQKQTMFLFRSRKFALQTASTYNLLKGCTLRDETCILEEAYKLQRTKILATIPAWLSWQTDPSFFVRKKGTSRNNNTAHVISEQDNIEKPVCRLQARKRKMKLSRKTFSKKIEKETSPRKRD